MSQTHSTYHKEPSEVIIIQRNLSHFKAVLFDTLAEKMAFTLVTAANLPRLTTGDLRAKTTKAEHHTIPFTFFTANPYVCHVPLLTIIKRYKPRVIILEAGSKMSSTYLFTIYKCLRLCGMRMPKIILWGHGHPVGTQRNRLLSLCARLVKSWLLRMSDGYLTYTERDAAYLRHLAPGKMVESFNNTIDIQPALKQRNITLHTTTRVKHILMVGRITPDKHFDTAIKLMPSIWQHHPNTHLTIIGGGDYLNTLVSLAGEELGKRIFLPGAVYKETELAPYYNRSQFFWLLGAAGLGVNHALAYGLPILAYAPEEHNIHAPHHHPEIAYIQPSITGWLVKADAQHTNMLQKITALLAHPSCRALLSPQLNTYSEDNLSIDFTIARIVMFTKQILEPNINQTADIS